MDVIYENIIRRKNKAGFRPTWATSLLAWTTAGDYATIKLTNKQSKHASKLPS